MYGCTVLRAYYNYSCRVFHFLILEIKFSLKKETEITKFLLYIRFDANVHFRETWWGEHHFKDTSKTAQAFSVELFTLLRCSYTPGTVIPIPSVLSYLSSGTAPASLRTRHLEGWLCGFFPVGITQLHASTGSSTGRGTHLGRQILLSVVVVTMFLTTLRWRIVSLSLWPRRHPNYPHLIDASPVFLRLRWWPRIDCTSLLPTRWCWKSEQGPRTWRFGDNKWS